MNKLKNIMKKLYDNAIYTLYKSIKKYYAYLAKNFFLGLSKPSQ